MDKNELPTEKDEQKQKSDKPKGDDYLDRWKNPEKNKMGNDISGDVKVANSNGDLEGGKDNRWHMDDDDQD